jgi:hypothetical protein
MSGLIDSNVFTIDTIKFNRALIRSKGKLDGPSMDQFDGRNESGVFRVKFCKRFYYLLTDPQRGQAQAYPTMNTEWKESVDSAAAEVLMHLVQLSSIVARRNTRTTSAAMKLFSGASSSPSEHFTFNEDLLPMLPATVSLTLQQQDYDETVQEYHPILPLTLLEQPQEQQLFSGASSSPSEHFTFNEDLLPMLPTTVSLTLQQQDYDETVQEYHPILPLTLLEQPQEQQHPIQLTSFWTSHESFNLFAGGSSTSYDEFMATNVVTGETVVDIVETHLAVLQAVSKTVDGWRDVVEGRDEAEVCTDTEIFNLKSRAMILCAAYRYAILHMNSWTWEQCCSEACRQLNDLGVTQATKFRSVQDWNVDFRKHRIFLHPNMMVRCGQRPLPLMLVKYPSAKDQMAAYGLSNLSSLTVESMQLYCIDELFPKLYKQWRAENDDAYGEENFTASVPTMANFLKGHGITTFGITTCLRWMKLIGFTYSHQRKSYYVDGHERDDVVASRALFCRKYLTEIEPRCLRWVQYGAEELLAANLDPDFGYNYTDKDGNKFYEFHIDYCCRRTSTADAMQGKIASMSVRAPPGSRPIECYGQDESLFSQFQFPSKGWVGPNLERALLPKSPGEGLMISAFLSRGSGFGMQLTAQELERVNTSRQGTHYIDCTAALEVNKHSSKKPLTQSPFVRDLLIGATKGGYWNGSHMALQLEDVVDVLRILRPDFDWVFFFDHSQGHIRKQEGALDAQMMSRSFGGKQPLMHSTRITDHGCLGPFPSKLNVGDLQVMSFGGAEDEGPWWLSPEAREKQRYDRNDGNKKNGQPTKQKNRTRAELASALLVESGITVESNRLLKDLKELATINGISLTHEKGQINEGWCGKPKGLLQVLWERGWIDESKCKVSNKKENKNTSFYTLNGRKDNETGVIFEASSLRALMGNCSDFKAEKSALEFLGSQLGCKVMLTPKFHCEFAGEGIEYSWAQAKAIMRRTPIGERRGRANFIPLVMNCLCPMTVLTKERIRIFAARARAYICTYYYLEHDERRASVDSEESIGFTPAGKQQLLYKNIEKIMKQFKTHRCALDFDTGFVLAELKGTDDSE